MKVNKKNLRKVAMFIKDIPQDHFDMSIYRKNEQEEVTPECNTVGCTLGHATVLNKRLFNSIKKRLNGELGRVSFSSILSEWTEKWLGISGQVGHDLDTWTFLFAWQWSRVDNTPQGAAKRILYYLENGLPTDGTRQMLGINPLCYTDIIIPNE